ncbi:hypothetical protein CS022_06575 [Veronia nyctiphanis]|uniref:Nickel/cobalt efflux system n=1 Tax=Veronia nyctiphanis TaxID=1278244 RepID=A0A4Q0YRW6_9GAMM|nr:nickel/cobalt transporter [Veronia nyctiphanis]RXJ73940.1 hypothetical protein CS022_06575 [Veronia nyctiphanis]
MKSSSASVQHLNAGMVSKLIFAVLVLCGAVFTYSQWGAVITTIIEWQKTLHIMLANHISAVSENPWKFGGALIGLSFAYGVFHAVGPGHGKAVIVTYLGTNKESLWKGISISLAAAIMQSFVAIALVSGLARVLKFRMAEVHNYGNDVALASYILVILLGVMLVITAISRLVKLWRGERQQHSVRAGEHSHDHSHGHDSTHHHQHHHDHKHDDHAHNHAHDAGCGCSHTHVPEENQSIWQTLVVIFSMGFRPCSGAIVVLIYAHLVGVYFYGVGATLMMGLGTGLSVSLLAVATLYARSWIERFVTRSGEMSEHKHLSLSNYVRFAGGIVLMLLGWSLYRAASAVASGHPLF